MHVCVFFFFSTMADKGRNYKKKNRKDHWFKPGNKFNSGSAHNSHLSRSDWVNSHPEEELLKTNYNLRPSSARSVGVEHSMMISHKKNTAKMWNYAFPAHSMMSPKCKKAQFEIIDKHRKGIVQTQSLKCKKCKYETPPFKTYEEIDEPHKRGPKLAVSNVALQNALLDTSIGQGKARHLLASIDVPPPSLSHLDKCASQTGEQIVKLGQENMDDNANNAVECGDGALICAADARYNTSRIGNSRRTGVPLANQCITLVIEKNTGKNKIVAQHTQNKLCHKGNLLRNAGHKISCPDHKGCSANVEQFVSLSESVGGLNVGRHFKQNQVKVSVATTDGDGRFVKGLEEGLGTSVERNADPVHLGQTQIKNTKKRVFSDAFFPG